MSVSALSSTKQESVHQIPPSSPLILQAIQNVAKGNFKNYPTLANFFSFQNGSCKEFASKFQKLSPGEQKFIKKALGKDLVKQILSESKELVIPSEASRLRNIGQCDVADSFRSYFPGNSLDHPLPDIQINGTSYKVPEFNQSTGAEKRQAFLKWLVENLNASLQHIQSEKSLDEQIDLLSQNSTDNKALCLQHIPCFFLLQSISISAFAKPSLVLREKSELFQFKNDIKQIKPDGSTLMRFEFYIDEKNACYLATQIKPFCYGIGDSGSFQASGALEIHHSCLIDNEGKYTTTLSYKNLTFNDNVKSKEQKDVRKKLDASFTSTNES